jgi:hypothetical protein
MKSPLSFPKKKWFHRYYHQSLYPHKILFNLSFPLEKHKR